MTSGTPPTTQLSPKARRALGCAGVTLAVPILALTLIVAAGVWFAFDIQTRIDAALAVAAELPLQNGHEPGTLQVTTQLHLDLPEGDYRLCARLPESYHESGLITISPRFSGTSNFQPVPQQATLEGDHKHSRLAWFSDTFTVPAGAPRHTISIDLTLQVNPNATPPSHLIIGVSSYGDLADYAGVTH
jgi:hypothetical protein